MKQVNIDPVKFWNEAMKDNFKDKVAEEPAEPEEEEPKALEATAEHIHAPTNALLKKNPDHFKELAKKGAAARWAKKEH